MKQENIFLKKQSKINIEYFLILAFTITVCISISTFASLVGIPVGITSSVTGLKNCAIAAQIKKYKSIIKRTRKKHDKILLLEKSKLNSISQALINLNVSYDEFVLRNNVLKEYDDMKEEIKNLKT